MQCRRRSPLRGCEEANRVAEEIKIRIAGAGFFRARHGMRTDEVNSGRLENRFQFRDQFPLGAADIGHDRPFFEERQGRPCQDGDLGDRHAKDDQIRIGERLFYGERGPSDHTHARALFNAPGAAHVTDHFPSQTARFEIQPQRASQEADSRQCDFFKHSVFLFFVVAAL